jgi:hypothetical protein
MPAQPRAAVSRPYRPSADAPAAGSPAPDAHWPHGADAPDDRPDALLNPVQRWTRATDVSQAKPKGVPASAFEAGAIAKAQAKKDRPRLKPLDLDKLVIESDVPLTNRRDPGADELAASIGRLLQKMRPGDSVLLDSGHGQAVVRWARAKRIAMRKRVQPDGSWRVWRVAAAASSGAAP